MDLIKSKYFSPSDNVVIFPLFFQSNSGGNLDEIFHSFFIVTRNCVNNVKLKNWKFVNVLDQIV